MYACTSLPMSGAVYEKKTYMRFPSSVCSGSLPSFGQKEQFLSVKVAR